MKKKGFTLTELLAVIVILAVIAVIATPAVLNIIEDSKQSAAEASARNIVSSAKTYYMKKIMEGESVTNVDLSSSTLKYDGEQATKGLLSYDKSGNAYGKMYISGYCVEIASNGTIISTKTLEEKCTLEITPSVTTFTNGSVVYYNPVTNTKCSSSEAVSTTGTKTGCMKWYIFLYDESDDVNLLLDHNTTGISLWNAELDNSLGPVEALATLEDDTSTWNSSLNPRLIKASEIASITGNTNWNKDSSDNWYYFHTNSQTEYKGTAGTNKYAWLFDNTYDCTTYGCSREDASTYGYWTDTEVSLEMEQSWLVGCYGDLNTSQVPFSGSVGIRPVITVDKNILK